ncbi:2-hydroxyacid dehydrogenase [Pelomicrobium sp.]|jgi:lactate dehydrogenase-like 2-hydroxyacid dehydrogenase|uniref:2-hydroxyacid dehydrogenase n=1 Tax=Pelomicrobium sp. TaxID=2815319 RepID=UPI002FDECC4E
MKPKVLVTREIFDEVLELLRQHFEVSDNQGDAVWGPEDLAQRLADKDGVMTSIVDRIDAALLDRAPRLKVVANIAVGYNNIDVAECTRRGILVTNTPGVLDEATADFTWALILGAARRLTEAEAYLRGGQWKRWELKQLLGADVHGATLGIIGMGRIGQAVARRALGFDMQVLYWNRHRVAPEVERRCNATFVSKEELLARSDFVTLHCPYTPETHHLIGASELRKMKRTAILINAARGGVVDDAALVAALRDGTIAAAGLDVYENEPNLHPEFLRLKNVVLAPHIASATHSTRLNMAKKAALNLVAALTRGDPPDLVNPEAKRRG